MFIVSCRAAIRELIKPEFDINILHRTFFIIVIQVCCNSRSYLWVVAVVAVVAVPDKILLHLIERVGRVRG